MQSVASLGSSVVLNNGSQALKTLWKSSVSAAVKLARAGADAGAALLEDDCCLENNVIKEEEARSHRLPQ